MKKIAILFLSFFSAVITIAQDDTSKVWINKGTVQLNFSQSAFRNWAGGGQNAVSATGLFNYQNGFETKKSSLLNTIDLAYGMLKQDQKQPVKTDDRIELSSKYGTQAFGKFQYSSLVSVRTQFAPGYASPEDSVKISDFLSPGYVITSIGLDYKPNASVSMMISPLTGKFTIVRDTMLSNAGAFGVEPGKIMRAELGGYLRLGINKDLMENVVFTSKLELFSNYLDNPQNIDVNWEVLLNMKVNKYITASISTQMIYDHDIDISVDENNDGVPEAFGPRTQWKEVFNLGIAYTF